MSKVQSIIFDVGGVLAHDVWEHLLLDERRSISSIYGLNRETVRMVGEDLWERFAYRTAEGQDGWKALEKEYWQILAGRFQLRISEFDVDRITDEFIRPVDGMIDLLKELESNRVEMAICSNNTEFWFHRQKEKLGLQRFFPPERTTLSCRVGVSKSSPGFEMFKCAANSLNSDKEKCLFVDDRSEVVLRGIEYGLTGVIFPSRSESGSIYLRRLLLKMMVI